MKTGYSSMKRRILAVIMSLVMIFQMLPAGALAEEEGAASSNTLNLAKNYA